MEKSMESGSLAPQESVPVVSKTEQQIQDLTKDFSDPELREFIRGLSDVTKDEIRDSYWENLKVKKTTRIQNMLALIEAVYDR